MPFIINGQKLNKPIYKGATLNAIHVWLQNHWTGTPNASTSTLSQDGTVVATNLVVNPGFESGDMTGWTVVSKNQIEAQGSSGISGYSGDWRAILWPGYPISQTVTVSGLSALHFGMVAYAAGDRRGVAVTAAFDGGTASTVLSSGVQKGSWVRVDVDITVPEGSTSLMFSIAATGSGVRFDNIILCTDADWQAMQALGVDWFSGDSYVRGGV